ncbi:MAG: adenylate/guanylate cyclase domain-containing protein [Deltaproteobacteria bacterium]|nr:adenylate/guanylate cyclase domain-containing protein [Deltaproteobacteria bacterium]
MSSETLSRRYCKAPADDPALLDYLRSLATTQDDGVQKRLLKELIRQYVALERRLDGLLKNTLPAEVADEIKDRGRFAPRACDCSILFADIAGFTRWTEGFSGERLVELLDCLFREMDDLVLRFRGTKIKTIGDAYMAVFGALQADEEHPALAVKTGLAMLEMVDAFNRSHIQTLRLRIGIHTGTVMAGVVGKERMQFDIFGDHVNIASRFESAGVPGRVNISHETYLRARDRFEFEARGEIALKHKASMKAYFVLRESHGTTDPEARL